MNTTQLECFVAVAENLNFARAAEQLHITQPAVTHQIVSLEEELDAKLFVRTTRTVKLTADGWSFLGDAKNILNMTYGAKARLAHPAKEEIRYFGVGCHSPLEMGMMPPAFRRLTELHPNVHPDIRMIPYGSLQNLLDDGSIEGMMGFRAENGRKTPGVFLELCKAPVSCVMAPDHPLASCSSITLKELRRGRMVLCEPKKSLAAIARVQGQLLGFHKPEELYFTEDSICALALVRAGLGFTLLPDLAPMQLPGLVYVPLADTEVLSYGMYYKSLKDKPLLKEFIEGMKEVFAGKGAPAGSAPFL